MSRLVGRLREDFEMWRARDLADEDIRYVFMDGCYHIVALKNAQLVDRRRVATVDDVEAAVPDALTSGSMVFFDIATQVGEAGVRLLERLAAAGEGGAKPDILSPAVGGECLDDEVFALLSRRELVETTAGGCRFQVELIRRWFAGPQRHPVEVFGTLPAAPFGATPSASKPSH